MHMKQSSYYVCDTRIVALFLEHFWVSINLLNELLLLINAADTQAPGLSNKPYAHNSAIKQFLQAALFPFYLPMVFVECQMIADLFSMAQSINQCQMYGRS